LLQVSCLLGLVQQCSDATDMPTKTKCWPFSPFLAMFSSSTSICQPAKVGHGEKMLNFSFKNPSFSSFHPHLHHKGQGIATSLDMVADKQNVQQKRDLFFVCDKKVNEKEIEAIFCL